jgi:hypothetical protein
MNDFQKRFLMFMIGCITVRSALAYGTKVINPNYLPYIGIIILFGAIRFIYLFFTNPTGPQFLGKDIWWNNIRPFHFVFYLLFAIFAFMKSPYAWIFLALDILFALLSFMVFHFVINDDYRLLFNYENK